MKTSKNNLKLRKLSSKNSKVLLSDLLYICPTSPNIPTKPAQQPIEKKIKIKIKPNWIEQPRGACGRVIMENLNKKDKFLKYAWKLT